MGENGSDLSSPKNHDVGFGISPEKGSWVGNKQLCFFLINSSLNKKNESFFTMQAKKFK